MATGSFFDKVESIDTTGHHRQDLPVLLVVDDEPHITASIADQFRRKFRVLTAGNGQDALQLLRENEVAIILADQRMPGMTGAELLSRASVIDAEAVRILLTGYADIDAVIEAVNVGRIFFYVTKPWKNNELEAVMARALEHKNLLQEKHHLLEELSRANTQLERRVAERTHELEERNQQLQEAYRLIEDLARHDALTGAANRRYFDEVLLLEASRGQRLNHPLALIMLDLDHFKSVNDHYGHPVGDAVLAAVGALLGKSARIYDLVARIGGEEFAILLPGVTEEQGVKIAERMRKGIEGLKVEGYPKQLTASFGVTVLEAGGAPEELVPRADAALYRAKANGRNRVEGDRTEDGER